MAARGRFWSIAGFGFVTLAFATTRPLLLAGLPLAVLLVAYGPRNFKAAIVIGALVGIASLGEKGDLWWFERGWPLLLGGVFVWIVSLRRRWSFSAQALAALAVTALILGGIMWASPRVWLELDASMRARALEAVDTTAQLFGGVDDTVKRLMAKVAALQVAIFPALLGVSSLGALGFAVSVSHWLNGDPRPAIGSLKRFRFNDHLIWVWVLGFVLVLAPVGQIAERVGSNAVFFMGALYIVRGLAVTVTMFEGLSVMAAIAGAAIALLLTPILIVLLALALALGLGDTWLNIRERVRSRRSKE